MPICIVEEITYQYPKRYFVMTALYGLCVLGFGLLQDGLDFFNFILLAEAVAMIGTTCHLLLSNDLSSSFSSAISSGS